MKERIVKGVVMTVVVSTLHTVKTATPEPHVEMLLPA